MESCRKYQIMVVHLPIIPMAKIFREKIMINNKKGLDLLQNLSLGLKHIKKLKFCILFYKTHNKLLNGRIKLAKKFQLVTVNNN